jgi:hypothetical protein
MKSIELSRAPAATMSLRLPGTVGKIANKMRYIDSKAPLFMDGGISRSIEAKRFDRIHAAGVASRSRSMPALGGILKLVGNTGQPDNLTVALRTSFSTRRGEFVRVAHQERENDPLSTSLVALCHSRARTSYSARRLVRA